ncbi:MAG TPA: cobalamin-dependent protein, partial [bacterium]|nr:cobalamin-dependent protein [bacterium]
MVHPRNPRGFWGQVTRGKTGFARLSLPAVAALTPPDWTVEILDARTVPAVDYSRPADLVGITAFTAEAPSAYEIADGFRRQGVPVVMGGVHASACPDEVLQHADAVVIGEADYVWAKVLADAAAGNLQPRYRAERYCDLRGMAVPRRDLLDRSMYVSGFHTVQATRGCPRDCAYCAVTGVFGRSFRTRPVAEVIAEISAFDTRDFFFVDDNICGNPAYARELFAALAPLRRTWGGQTEITLAR